MHAEPSRCAPQMLHKSSAPAADAAAGNAAVISQFVSLNVTERARVLGRLLSSVGPLALTVVGEGAFAKYVKLSRLPEIPVSIEDAARTTPSQISDLIRYVQQSDPQLFSRLLCSSEAPAAAH